MLISRYRVSLSVTTDHRAPYVANKLHFAELITALPDTVIYHHDCLKISNRKSYNGLNVVLNLEELDSGRLRLLDTTYLVILST